MFFTTYAVRVVLSFVCLDICQYHNSWTVGDNVTNFSHGHPVVERADKFDQTVNDGVAHFKNPKKCGYHVTFDLDLDLDLEHTLDARWPGVHRVQVWWRPGHLSARRSNLSKSLQTDDGPRTIALAHSWNELKMAIQKCMGGDKTSLMFLCRSNNTFNLSVFL